MSEEAVYEVLAAFDNAKTKRDYKKAKQLCERKFTPVGQLAFIDAARAAHARVGGAL